MFHHRSIQFAWVRWLEFVIWCQIRLDDFNSWFGILLVRNFQSNIASIQIEWGLNWKARYTQIMFMIFASGMYFSLKRIKLVNVKFAWNSLLLSKPNYSLDIIWVLFWIKRMMKIDQNQRHDHVLMYIEGSCSSLCLRFEFV